jgi:enamine deaminase RidA (YjgF/YER057c/UK114 family)
VKITERNSKDAPMATGGYAQAVSLQEHRQLLFISGQIPETVGGSTPTEFKFQCELVWANITAQLKEAGLTVNNLVKVTTFLSSRKYANENSTIRQHILGSHSPALTVIISDIYDESWLLEIEAIAAA